MPTLLFERGFSVVKSLTFVSVMSVCNPLGALLAADLMERFERRWFNAAACFLVVVCGLAYGFSRDPTWIMVFGALVVIGLQAGATGSYIYASELFSTDVRSLGTGFTYGPGHAVNPQELFVCQRDSRLGPHAVTLAARHVLGQMRGVVDVMAAGHDLFFVFHPVVIVRLGALCLVERRILLVASRVGHLHSPGGRATRARERSPVVVRPDTGRATEG